MSSQPHPKSLCGAAAGNRDGKEGRHLRRKAQTDPFDLWSNPNRQAVRQTICRKGLQFKTVSDPAGPLTLRPVSRAVGLLRCYGTAKAIISALDNLSKGSLRICPASTASFPFENRLISNDIGKISSTLNFRRAANSAGPRSE